jgi:hypothetical protein
VQVKKRQQRKRIINERSVDVVRGGITASPTTRIITELTGINTLTECAGVSADSDECSTYSLGASKAKEIVHAVLFYE